MNVLEWIAGVGSTVTAAALLGLVSWVLRMKSDQQELRADLVQLRATVQELRSATESMRGLLEASNQQLGAMLQSVLRGGRNGS